MKRLTLAARSTFAKVRFVLTDVDETLTYRGRLCMTSPPRLAHGGPHAPSILCLYFPLTLYGYKGDEAARLKVYEDNAERWGKDWIVIANPTYGSFESAPYRHDYKVPVEAQRAAKEKALEVWRGP